MSSRRTGIVLAVVFLVICVLAWFDGGEEPLRPIEQAVLLPGGAQ